MELSMWSISIYRYKYMFDTVLLGTEFMFHLSEKKH